MTKTLKTIQTIAKVGRIISKIVFIFSIIGAILCSIGVAALAGTQNMEIEGPTVAGLIEKEAEIDFVTAVFSCVSAVIACIGSAVLAKFAVIYFTNELDDGTPFTYAGAKELMRLGTLTVAIPLAISIVTSIAFGFTKLFWPSLSESALSEDSISIGIGLLLIVMSLVFQHGAELVEKNQGDNQ